MASYTSYNEAFNNNDNYNLDKLARRINNDKKKLHKKIKNDISERENNAVFAIDYLNDSDNIHYSTNLKNAGYFSTQGDFSSKLPTPMEKYYKKSKSISDSDSMFTKSTTYTNNTSCTDDSYVRANDSWDNSENDLSSNYSSLTPKMKKKFRQNTKHLKKYTDTEEKNILSHIKKCENCQNDLFSIVQNRHILKNNNDNNLNNNNNNHNNKNLLNISHPELILILVGIFVIIFIDIFFRR